MSREEEYKEFINSVKKVNNHRVHKVTNCYGVRDAYQSYTGEYIPIKQFSEIVQYTLKKARIRLSEGHDIKFPKGMGSLEIRKYDIYYRMKNDKLVTNAPIDWSATLKLWFEDEYSKINKVLIKSEVKEVYKVYYNSTKAKYKNNYYYVFNPNRTLKLKLKQNIQEGNIEAFKLNNKQ